MSTRSCLFIGGPWDGRREQVHVNHDQYMVPEPTNLSGITYSPDENYYTAEAVLTTHRYRRQQLRSHDGVYFVFLHESLESSQIIHYLLEGYRSEGRGNRSAHPSDVLHPWSPALSGEPAVDSAGWWDDVFGI